jgi:hypothetical protein
MKLTSSIIIYITHLKELVKTQLFQFKGGQNYFEFILNGKIGGRKKCLNISHKK